MLKAKIKILVICGVAAIFLVAPFAVGAVNNVTLNGPINFQLNIINPPFNSTTIIGQSGGAFTDMAVNASDMIITLDDAASTIQFNKTSGSTYFQITEVTAVGDYSVAPACPDSSVILSGGTSGSVQLKIEMTNVRPGCLGSLPVVTGGGGGGSVYPTNYSIKINDGQTCSESNSVVLQLAASNATDVLISNNPTFSDASWQAFTFNTIYWNLEAGDGIKSVYVWFRSSSGDYSPILSSTIVINSAGCQETPVIPPETDVCTVECQNITYDLYLVNPDLTERHLGSNYVRVVNTAKDVYNYYFEDKGGDFDYNDVVIRVDKSSCSTIITDIVDHNSGWSHQIKMRLILSGVVKEDLLLWADDHLAENAEKVINLNTYSSLCPFAPERAQVGDVLKGSSDTVYYFGSNYKRYVFPNSKTFLTWFFDFSAVKKVGDDVLAVLPMGKNVTYRPGVRMVKITTDPKVYAVDAHGTLRWILNEEVAAAIYGANWQKLIDDVSDAYFVNYQLGELIDSPGDFDPLAVTLAANDIEQDLNIK